MHDIKAIRDDEARYARGWSSRGMADAAGAVGQLVDVDREFRAVQTALQSAQSRRNEASRLIGAAKAQKDEARAQALMAEVAALKAQMDELFVREGQLGQALKDALATLPNLPADDVPEGADEHGNVEIKRVGDPKALPAGKLNDPQDHVTIGERMGLMDFEGAARMSGARFVAMKGGLARMERALGQFMLDIQTGEHGYQETSVPLFVRQDAMFGTGQLPKFYDDAFLVMDPVTRTELLRAALAPVEVQGAGNLAEMVVEILSHAPMQEQYFAIPTAEVSLTNLVREQITDEAELPLRMTALTPCFRAEAGASGRDTRGIIRQHQFWKCELVSITTPEQSDEEHERMTACAETVLERLGLPYRRMLLCTGDMGFSARKTYDLEVWLPSQGTYREISSCSNCGDFQARRMEARCKVMGEKGGRYVHTLNGSGLAVGRTLVAILENYQDGFGGVIVPEALRPYMGGLERLA
jgi:seryl-tRNA synthetase